MWKKKHLTSLFYKRTASRGHQSGRKQEFGKWAKGRLKCSNRKRPGICSWLSEGAEER